MSPKCFERDEELWEIEDMICYCRYKVMEIGALGNPGGLGSDSYAKLADWLEELIELRKKVPEVIEKFDRIFEEHERRIAALEKTRVRPLSDVMDEIQERRAREQTEPEDQS